MDTLIKRKEYQTVICYLGYYHEAVAEFMKQSDKVFYLKGNEAVDQALYSEWSRQMNCIGIDPEQEKFHIISLTQERREAVGYRSFADLAGSNIWNLAEEGLLQA